jgi:hypothetical protein
MAENKKRRPTSADRCEDCVLHRAKALRFNSFSIDDDMFLDFEACLETETPFWCHGPNERQVCRGWLAIMERRWARDQIDITNPRMRGQIEEPRSGDTGSLSNEELA